MPISREALRDCIHRASFPLGKRDLIFGVISEGLKNFREHQKRWYYGSRGKPIKKPTAAHEKQMGRHDQSYARFVLIAALCRAWWRGFEVSPTLNHKNDPDSAFANFAMDVMSREGIGHIHQHLEEYWSFAKAQIKENEFLVEKWRLSGGSKDDK